MPRVERKHPGNQILARGSVREQPMTAGANHQAWPSLAYEAWQDTCATLHLWTQIVGKVRLAFTPWLNHSWHVPFYVNERGVTTSPIPLETRSFALQFDFIDHVLDIEVSDGSRRRIGLAPMAVADFYAKVVAALRELGIAAQIGALPCEIPGAIPFGEDRTHAAYDADHARRFWHALVAVDRVLKRFRTGFIGKCSPVHFFWGSFDLAVTRFSGRRAPPHPGGAPGLSDAVMREAYSHEVSSAGFWPGGGAINYAAFYSYAYPMHEGFKTSAVRPEAAYFNDALGEFLLPYDAVRAAGDPEAALLDFLQSTYEAAANAGNWDREALECPLGIAGVPRFVA
jgi:hypothetical protein